MIQRLTGPGGIVVLLTLTRWLLMAKTTGLPAAATPLMAGIAPMDTEYPAPTPLSVRLPWTIPTPKLPVWPRSRGILGIALTFVPW